MKKILNIIPYLLVIIFSIPSVIAVFHTGFFPTHDDTQPSRIFEMYRSLSSGIFPVRFVPDLGYGFGYPLFNFYAPLSFYIGVIIYSLGFGAINSFKILIALAIFLSGISMYLLCREFFGKAAGIIGAIFYVFATYHAVQIYVRGDEAEYFAYSLIPFLFFYIYKLYLSFNLKNALNSWLYFSLSSLFFALIAITHNLSGIIVSIFALIFVIVLFFKNPSKKAFLFFICLFILGGMLSAFYSIPAILEIKYTNVLGQLTGGADYSKNFVCLSQFWYSPWGYGGSVSGCIDGLSFMIGKLHIIFSLFALILSLVFIKKFKNRSFIIIFSFICFLISVFLQTNSSEFLWKIVPIFKFLQYPWRFLMMTSFFTSICAAGLFSLIFKLNTKFKLLNYVLLIMGVVSVIILQYKFFRGESYLNINDSDYVFKANLNYKISKISDEYLPKEFSIKNLELEIRDNLFINNKNINVMSIRGNLPKIVGNLYIKNNTSVLLHLSYFPYWHVKIDNKEVLIKNNNGLVNFSITKGFHNIEIYYKQTTVETLSDLVSLCGILIIFTGILILLKNKKYNSHI